MPAGGRRAGGDPGGICQGPGQAADGLAINPGALGDLALAGPALKQGLDGDAQMWLQDVHSFLPLGHEGGEGNVSPPAVGDQTRLCRPGGVGEFQVATGGGVWVAAGAIGKNRRLSLRIDPHP